MSEKYEYWVGLDVGSTTVKIAVIEPSTQQLLYSDYQRHNANQANTVLKMLSRAHSVFPNSRFKLAVCGSGGLTIAEHLKAFFIQEVVANSIAIRRFYKDVRVAIELGGQDAKVIFFRYDEQTEQLIASDMRMNGSCAGGTGAFIDQIAELLNVSAEDFGKLAERGNIVYEISGRCGVFAKTDIQPLLNQGARKEDIALSTFHAIAKQVIGGLAQGMDFYPKVIFEGGPLTFNPRLIEVFKERLMLSDDDIIIPQNPEIIVAWGAAISIGTMFEDKTCEYSPESSLLMLTKNLEQKKNEHNLSTETFFKDDREREAFYKRTALPEFIPPDFPPGSEIRVYLGIDAGSTTTKFVLIDEHGNLIYRYYSNNHGDPLRVIKTALIEMRDSYRARGVKLQIIGVGTTGYGEMLFQTALNADYHTIETVAHAEAAQTYVPGATFVLDIGGQDMKAINLQDGIVTGIVLNEACSAGCGSFIETYARSLNIPIQRIAQMAFDAKHPSRLGSRCTVFMNSSIITEQKNGKTPADIMAGLCRSIIENVFTKVIRVSNMNQLGERVVVQGGTFKNDAVLRAMEQYIGREVIRPPFPGEMGAIGVALLTKKSIEERVANTTNYRSSFIGLDNLEKLSYTRQSGVICRLCANNCSRTVVTFNTGKSYITGNRCERGQVIGDLSDPAVRSRIKQAEQRMREVPDMVKLRNELIFKDYPIKQFYPSRGIKIGIPRTLLFYDMYPFSRALLKGLGFEVVLSRRSTYDLFEKGLQFVQSDTVCFPAKLAHGHIQDLIAKKVDRIFFPMWIRVPSENPSSIGSHVCAIVQGYPIVIAHSDDPEHRNRIPFDHPTFHWFNRRLMKKQTVEYIRKTFGIPTRIIKRAYRQAIRIQNSVRERLQKAGQQVLNSLKGTQDFAVLLAARTYHSDELVNHNLSTYFTRMGIPVLTVDSLPKIHRQDLRNLRLETTVLSHSQILAATMFAARHPNLEIVQMVSFGCGHDALVSDEIIRMVNQLSNKQPLILKLDEGDAVGPLNIRIKSFIQTVRTKRRQQLEKPLHPRSAKLKEAFIQKFTHRDKKHRTILVPNLSRSFSYLISSVVSSLGYRVVPLPLADKRAIELGKKYVHNDICFPAQVNVGEALARIEKGDLNPNNIAIGFAKNCDDCRAGQYSAIARKAFDEAGYPNIPIITTGKDTKNIHPGFRLGIRFQYRMLWGLTMVDGLEMMRRRVRPYEVNSGETDRVFDHYLELLSQVLRGRKTRALEVFREAVHAFNRIEVHTQSRRPRVGIVGEILVNYHPSANQNIERYLENNGMEVVIPSMLDFFRRSAMIERDKSIRRLVPNPWINFFLSSIQESMFTFVVNKVNKVLDEFRFAEPHYSVYDMVERIKPLIDVSYVVGEGWLIPGEISMLTEQGVKFFVIVQPFGCLPNHITGRGMIKALKKLYPHISIIALDFDPDTSFANIENRLQMLIVTAKESEKSARHKQASYLKSNVYRKQVTEKCKVAQSNNHISSNIPMGQWSEPVTSGSINESLTAGKNS